MHLLKQEVYRETQRRKFITQEAVENEMCRKKMDQKRKVVTGCSFEAQ
jgi:hypothetical protein